MHVFIEIWNAKPAWLSLSGDERGAFMGKIGAAMAGIETKFQPVGWGVADKAFPHAAGEAYFAVWTTETLDAVAEFNTILTENGWYDLFDQKNIVGEAGPPDPVIGALIGL